MVRVVKTTTYAVEDNGLVREFNSMRDAQKFMELWIKFKKEADNLLKTIFEEFDEGLHIEISWTKGE